MPVVLWAVDGFRSGAALRLGFGGFLGGRAAPQIRHLCDVGHGRLRFLRRICGLFGRAEIGALPRLFRRIFMEFFGFFDHFLFSLSSF